MIPFIPFEFISILKGRHGIWSILQLRRLQFRGLEGRPGSGGPACLNLISTGACFDGSIFGIMSSAHIEGHWRNRCRK